MGGRRIMAKSEKIIVLGVDGMDPVFTKYMLEKGEMPHVKKYIEMGGCREDLVMLGGVPTITPPMWTTLATGAYPNTHGITCFWNQHPEKLDTLVYALDSRKCKAEQVWNVLAEAGKKTLVWHWPGSSWPPSSDSPNLHVVEGTQPPEIHGGVGIIDADMMVTAKTDVREMSHINAKKNDSGAGCVITDLETTTSEDDDSCNINAKETTNVLFSHLDGEASSELLDMIERYETPLAKPEKWVNAPADAKEFSILTSKGIKKYPCLLLKNAAGEYRKVAIYKNKQAAEPMLLLDDESNFIEMFIDEVNQDGTIKHATRSASILEVDPAGESVVMWFSAAFNIDLEPDLWSPKRLYQDVLDHVGPVPAVANTSGSIPYLMERRLLPVWNNYQKWQGKAMRHLIETEGYEMVFSHLHNVDLIGHICWRWAKHRDEYQNDEKLYQGYLEEIYRQTDDYLGGFLPLLEKEGWTVIITSDHGLLCAEEDEIPLLGEGFGLNVGVMRDLGYTVMQKDANGEDIKKVDWAKTRAVSPRGNHIYINLKGRYDTGIVEPEDKYDLEAQIISDLYNYRIDGKRVVQLAVRNKDAAVFGLSGPECGDIIYFVEEGFNRLHGDSWSTTTGYFHTSVQPIFIAAGRGIKQGYTDRVIREVDVAPTIAALAGVRMPAQCEGAPVYQIIEA